MLFSTAFSLSFLASLLTAIIIVGTQRFHGHLSLDNLSGVQKLHLTPVPRVGGVALLFGALVGGWGLPPEAQTLWYMICISVFPAFIFGFAEDVTKRVGVKPRLLATICSGIIFCSLTGYQITNVDIQGIDWILSFWPVSLLFTAFAIGGIANAINIIDGVNGLALGTSIIILSGFAIVAGGIGDLNIVGICVVGMGALAGIFVLNFPKGNIFLGDAGAYSIGFFLAVIAIALPSRNPEISPLIGLLALAYPVIETMVSILRRTVREGGNPGQADRLHLHSLVYRCRARRMANALGAPQLRNAMTGLIMMTIPLVSTALMVMFHKDSILIAVSVAVVATLYIAVYRKAALLPPIFRFRRRANLWFKRTGI